MPWDMLVSHFAIGAGALLASFFLVGPSIWRKLALLPVLISFVLLKLPNNLKLVLDPPWNILLAALQITPVFIGLLALALILSDPESQLLKLQIRFPRTAKAVRMLTILVVSFLAMEIGLRQIGYAPGVINRNVYLNNVAQLVHYPTYATDENGIYSMGPQARATLERQLNGWDDPAISKEWPEELYFGENWILQDHLQILRGELKNDYTELLEKIKLQPQSQRDPVDQAYLDQLKNPINPNGFRSIPFRNDSTAKKKVLMIGDSFTWGHSASYFSTAFPDILITKGFAIYNAGISATDPAQYEAIAKRFVPIILPDVVVVNLYMRNDIFYFERPAVAFRPPLYLTNAGMILAYPGPEWLPNADSAYAFVDREQRIPQGKGLFWNKLLAQTSLGTLIWRGLQAAKIIPYQRPNADYWNRCEALIQEKSVTGEHLRAIKAISTANGARLLVAVIPQNPEDADSILMRYPEVFEGVETLIPKDLDAQDYTQRGGHFNDAGHRKFAEMLAKALR